MNYTLQRKYRSLERRREPKRVPNVPKLPEKVFYRILDDGSSEGTRNKKHVKFQLFGAEDHEETSIFHSDLSPVPARYLHQCQRTPEHPCTRYLCLNESAKESRRETRHGIGDTIKEALFD